MRRNLVVGEIEGKGNNQGIIIDKDIFRPIMKNQDLTPIFLSENLPV
jgi:hypothetical protein